MRYVLAATLGCILMVLVQVLLRGVPVGGEMLLPILCVLIMHILSEEEDYE